MRPDTSPSDRNSCAHSNASPPRPKPGTRVAAWIDYYNRERRHSACRMLSPINYELATATVELATATVA
ncbi:hypothetical protein GCM10009609_48690 [Pseudonocardia aurantiaca]